jgi:hypothetical protein
LVLVVRVVQLGQLILAVPLGLLAVTQHLVLYWLLMGVVPAVPHTPVTGAVLYQQGVLTLIYQVDNLNPL